MEAKSSIGISGNPNSSETGEGELLRDEGGVEQFDLVDLTKRGSGLSEGEAAMQGQSSELQNGFPSVAFSHLSNQK